MRSTIFPEALITGRSEFKILLLIAFIQLKPVLCSSISKKTEKWGQVLIALLHLLWQEGKYIDWDFNGFSPLCSHSEGGDHQKENGA